MSITGKALKIERKHTVSPCGFEGLAGYKPQGDDGAIVSFMPKTHKVEMTVTFLHVDGREARVTKSIASKWVTGMWTFFIKYQE